MPLYPPFYPPAYPTRSVPPAVPEQLLVNGESLNKVWCQVEGLSSLLTGPARRGGNVVVPGRHGVIRTPAKHYNPLELVIPMHVKGVRPTDGTIPSDPAAQLYRNVDRLLDLLQGEVIDLLYVRSDGTSRAAVAELITEPITVVRERSFPPLARVSVALVVIDAFWTDINDAAQIITGPTGTTVPLTAFAGSTAPIADARITFYGPISNPRLAIGERWVRYNGVIPAGRQLVLECKHWRATSGSGAVWDPDERQVYREPGPAWLEIPPSYAPLTAVFTHTGGGSATVEISGNRKFLTA